MTKNNTNMADDRQIWIGKAEKLLVRKPANYGWEDNIKTGPKMTGYDNWKLIIAPNGGFHIDDVKPWAITTMALEMGQISPPPPRKKQETVNGCVYVTFSFMLLLLYVSGT
jgi:hypothetical protein